MKWLNTIIELDTVSTTWGIFVFSIISAFCSTITIIIYLRMKSLRTLIYHFFFHVAINEWLSKFAYLLLFTIDQQYNITIFRISAFLIYLTDANILILVAFVCFGMYQLILKQNTKLSLIFHKISIGLYTFSLIMTIIFFVISDHDPDNSLGYERDRDLFRNVLSLYFITDGDTFSLPSIVLTNILYWLLLLISIVNIILIQIFVKDRANSSTNVSDVQMVNEDKKIKSSLKLRTFRLKIMSYPGLILAYILPLGLYTWIEYVYLKDEESFSDNIEYLRTRYFFFNIYGFLSSIRGWLFFRVFITNEKIKIYIFKKYLFFEIFKTIDYITAKEKGDSKRTSSFIEGKSVFTIENPNFDTISDGVIATKKEKKKEEKKEEEKSKDYKDILDLDPNTKKAINQIGLISEDEDNSDDDNDDEKKLALNSKSQEYRYKKI